MPGVVQHGVIVDERPTRTASRLKPVPTRLPALAGAGDVRDPGRAAPHRGVFARVGALGSRPRRAPAGFSWFARRNVIDFAISACADWRMTTQPFLGIRGREPSYLLPTNDARRRPPASRIVRHDPRFAPRVSAAHDPTPSGSTSSAAGCDANGIPGHGWPPGWCSCGEELAPGTQVPGAFHAHTGDAATTSACDCRPRNYPMIDRRV